MVQSFRTKRWNSPPQLRESLPPLALLTHAPLTLEVKLPLAILSCVPLQLKVKLCPLAERGDNEEGWQLTAADDIAK